MCAWQLLVITIFCNTSSVLQFDITFPSIPCTLLSVDTTDISGEQHHDIVCSEVILLCDDLLIYLLILHIMAPLFFSLQRHDIEKRRLDSHGNVIEARKEGIGGTKVSDVCFRLAET